MSTKAKITSVIVAVIILGGGFIFLRSGRSEITVGNITAAEASRAVEVLSRDEDEDGLKDWEEELWHTDKRKPDTDGDGTPDGEEVKTGRDPAKPGPDDALDEETIESKTVPGGGGWSETDRLSREFFAKYLSLKQSGTPFTAAEEEKLLDEFLVHYPEQKPRTLYTENDITLSEQSDAASLHAYGNALGGIIAKHKEPEGAENELIIFERALENEDEIDLENLNGRIARYGKIITDIAAVPVPKTAAPLHLDILNAIESLKESVQGMSGAFSDSVRALSAAAAYPTALTNLTKAFSDLATFFKQKNVTFEENEPGRILTQ